MENQNENKFEVIASYLHGEEGGDVLKDLHDDADFKAVKRIYAQREKVRLLSRLSRIADAKKKVDQRLRRRPELLAKKQKQFRYAAVFLVLVALAGVFGRMIYQFSLSEKKESITGFASSTGEIKELDLPDGTKVWLGSNSTLKYNNHFGTDNRTVTFGGEAMFDVAKDEKLAFLVKIENASIKVHGTRFLVTSYSKGGRNEIILLRGQVEYLRQGQNYFMFPGQRISDNRYSGKIVFDHVDLDHYDDWVKGKIYVDHEMLGELAFSLEQWYGVKFIFSNDSLKTYKFTGTINKDKPLDYTLNVITLTNKVKFKKGENGITITN